MVERPLPPLELPHPAPHSLNAAQCAAPLGCVNDLQARRIVPPVRSESNATTSMEPELPQVLKQTLNYGVLPASGDQRRNSIQGAAREKKWAVPSEPSPRNQNKEAPKPQNE